MPTRKPSDRPSLAPDWIPVPSLAWKIALTYAALSALWIFLTDHLLHLAFYHAAAVERWAMLKGWFFVAITALLLGIALHRYFARIRESARTVRASEDFASTVLDQLSAKLVVLDDHGCILMTNDSWRRFHPEHTGLQADYLAVCPATKEGADANALAIAKGIKDVLSGRCASFEFEYSCQPKDQVQWFTARVTPLPGDSARRALVVHEDITERKKVQEELRRRIELQDQLAKVATTVPGVICSFRLHPDGALSVPFASAAVESVFGVTPDDLERDTTILFSTIHPDDIGRVRETFAESARNTSPWQAEFRVRHPRLGEIWVEGQSMPQSEAGGGVLWHGFVHDITGRKMAAERLAASEYKYRSLYQGTLDGFASCTLDGQIVEANQVFLDMIGYSANELTGLCYKDITPKAWHDVEARFVAEQVLVRGYSEIYQKEYLRKDGTRLPVELRTQLVKDESGAPIGMWALVRDITERKRAEEVLTFLAKAGLSRAGEPFFNALARYLARSLGVDHVRINRLEGDGTRTRTVAMWQDGRFADNITYPLRDTPCAAVVEKSAASFPAGVCDLFPRDQVLQDLRAECYVGVALWGHTGQPVGLIAVAGRSPLSGAGEVENVLKLVAVRAAGELERQEAEETLRESENKFSRAFHSSPVPMSLSTFEEGRHLDVNAEFLRMLERDRAEVLGHTLSELNASTNREQQSSLLAMLRGKGAIRSVQMEVRAKSGRCHHVLWSAEEVVIAGQRCLLGSGIDITERRRAEEQLHSSLEEKTALLKEVHHRVKNNLQIVASLLSLQAGRVQHPQTVEVLQDTRNRVHSMSLLHEVLYSSGNLAQVNFAAYVDRLCSQLLQSVGQAAQRVRIELQVTPVGLPLAQSVPCGLILTELISNALKHAFPGGRSGTITVEMRRTEQHEIHLRVCDDGVGLPKGQAPAAYPTLGFRLIGSLAGQLQGRWHVETDGNTGCAFRVVFPSSAG